MQQWAQEGEEAEGRTLLLLASDPSVAVALAASLAGQARIRPVSPDEVPAADSLVDVPGMLVHIDAREPDATLAAALRLRELRAGRNILLMLSEDLGEAAIEEALAALEPVAVLPCHPPSLLLRHAVASLLTRTEPERRSARVQYRPTSSLLGVSVALRDVIEQVRRIAPTRMSVLILGETGTGKELVARAVHEHSPRSEHPFVAINCGAIPETLLEAELFGVCRGAFTGAERDRPGLFAESEGGTLFLDEIGDTPPSLQAKLLRVIESKEVRPIGGSETRCVDVRIISATHRDLEAAVKEGDFRQDLFFRINTATIHVPPLRRRPVDIPFLAQHFAEEFGAEHARRIVLHEDFLEALSNRQFPGNVRELRNTVERAIALAEPGEAVTADILDPPVGEASAVDPQPAEPAAAQEPVRRGTLREQVEELETEAIRQVLTEVDGNRTRAAGILGLSRQGLRQKIERYGL